MTQNPSHNDELVSIGKAAEMLGVSVDTVRRWEKEGRISSTRSDGGHRLFNTKDLQDIAEAKTNLSISKAAEYLGVSVSTLRRYEKQGLITPNRSKGGSRLYSASELDGIEAAKDAQKLEKI